MEFIQVTAENLEREHICCAIASGRDCQVLSKKSWLAERFDEGLTFWKADARGKCFIEYIPGENAWAPVEAEGLMWIDCLWVSGQLAGHGYADELLERCFMDTRAQGRQGMAILASDKKRGFLADPRFLEHKGFTVADQAGYFRLYWKPIDEMVQPPRFLDLSAQKACGQTGRGWSSTIPINAPLRPSMPPSPRRRRSGTASPFRLSAWRAGSRPGRIHRPLPRTACSGRGNL